MRASRRFIFIGALALLCAPLAAANQLVFGSFRAEENANNWAQRLRQNLATQVRVEPHTDVAGVRWYRVVSEDLAGAQLDRLSRRASAAGVTHWRKYEETGADSGLAADSSAAQPTIEPARAAPAIPRVAPATPSGARQHSDAPAASGASPAVVSGFAATDRIAWDLGVTPRVFFEEGTFGQDEYEISLSAEATYTLGWDGDRQSVTFTPFVRLDSADSERSHGDIRELYYSRVGDDWDVHIGARRVFWGVAEFNHLVDIINQTDLVENIDTEDKLGQPMAQLSLVRDWGILDLYALVGFRERTFPGADGRLRLPFAIDRDDVRYESGAEEYRVDAAVRWSHNYGPLEFGLHHFSGTSRDPVLTPRLTGAGNVVLMPFYPVIDQTGVDAQYFVGDWAFKLEGFSRSGFGTAGAQDRYAAATLGFERTLVGVLGSRTDLGLVAEYMWDERDDEAFNTLFEHDLALGTRFAFNDFADTQALFGIIYDTDNDDVVISLEASRRLSESWQMSIEARLFEGGEDFETGNLVPVLLDPDFKSAPLQDDDYIQIEFMKFL